MTTDGRLRVLRVVPAERSKPVARQPDWSVLIEAAGLSLSDLDATTPTATPPDFADAHAAWLTRAAEPGALRMRVEATALDGVPLSFRVVPDLPAEATAPPAAATARDRVFYLLLLTLLTGVLVAALWLARRNLRTARADRQGALRVAGVVIAFQLVDLTVAASHAPVLAEFGLLFLSVAWMLLAAGVVWVLYVALEPLLRRRSPGSLVSWTRLLAGRAGDPLVGRDLLLGALIGAAIVTIEALTAVWLLKSGQEPVAGPQGVGGLIGVPAVSRTVGVAVMFSFVQAMGFLVLWQLASWALRSSVRGALALGAVLLFGLSVADGVGVITLFLVANVVLMVFAYTRLGLLASVTMLWVMHFTFFFPLYWNPSAWFFGEAVVLFVLGALPALWGAWVATRGNATAAALP